MKPIALLPAFALGTAFGIVLGLQYERGLHRASNVGGHMDEWHVIYAGGTEPLHVNGSSSEWDYTAPPAPISNDGRPSPRGTASSRITFIAPYSAGCCFGPDCLKQMKTEQAPTNPYYGDAPVTGMVSGGWQTVEHPLHCIPHSGGWLCPYPYSTGESGALMLYTDPDTLAELRKPPEIPDCHVEFDKMLCRPRTERAK